MRLEFFADAALSLVAVTAMLWYVTRLQKSQGRPAWDRDTILLAAAIVVVLLLVLFG
jgi:hypothetical protein